MDADTIISGLIFISNLGGNSTLVYSTGREASLAALEPSDGHRFPAVDIALLREWLLHHGLGPLLHLTFLAICYILAMLLLMNLFDCVLGRFQQVAVAGIIGDPLDLLSLLVEKLVIYAVDTQTLVRAQAFA